MSGAQAGYTRVITQYPLRFRRGATVSIDLLFFQVYKGSLDHPENVTLDVSEDTFEAEIRTDPGGALLGRFSVEQPGPLGDHHVRLHLAGGPDSPSDSVPATMPLPRAMPGRPAPTHQPHDWDLMHVRQGIVEYPYGGPVTVDERVTEFSVGGGSA